MRRFVYALLIIFMGCQNSHSPKRPLILVSITPYVYFVQKIAQESVEIKVIVPANANPHNFEPTPDQTKLLARAIVWFKIGESFEKKAGIVLKEHNPNLTIYDLRKNIELIKPKKHCHSDLEDRHIWLSPILAKVQATTIANALIETFPENKTFYENNLKSFLKELDLLNSEIKVLIGESRESIIVSHPTFTYFCQEYGVEQIVVEGIKELGSKQICKALKQAQSQKNAAVFIQPQYNNKSAELIAKKLKIETTKVDPYSMDYANTLRFIAQTINKIHERNN